MKKITFMVVMIVALFGGTLFASYVKPALAQAPPPTAPSKWTPELTKVIEGAKKEGKIQLVSSPMQIGSEAQIKQLQNAMNRMFNTKIDIQFTPGPAMAKIGSQIATESAAGQPALTDVYITGAFQAAPLQAETNVLDKIDWVSLLPSRITPQMVEADFALKYFSGIIGVAYNTNLVPPSGHKMPQTIMDFLGPEYKGKIISTQYAAGFDVLASDEMWGSDKTFEYLKKLAKQVTGLTRCGVEERIASGEFAALVLSCHGAGARRLKAKGAPIDYLVPIDAAQVRAYYLTVPKNAAHPNAAKLFSVFMLTEEGQRLLWKHTYADLHLLPNSNMGRIFNQARKAGAKLFEPVIPWLWKHPELDKMKSEMIKILKAGSGK